MVALPADVRAELKAEANRCGIPTRRHFSVEPNADTLAKISRLIDNGEVRPTVSAVYPLADAQAAQLKGRAGHLRGARPRRDRGCSLNQSPLCLTLAAQVQLPVRI